MPTMVRGIRGATTSETDAPEAVLSATRELLLAILEANPTLRESDIASIFFTVTQDLQTEFPAKAARTLGWVHVPMLNACEIPVPGSLARCIRILVFWNTELEREKIRHIYLHDAVNLRPDLMQ